MINHFVTNDEIEDAEEINDEDATLADDLLDEVGADEVEDDAVEGFGILPEVEEEDEEEEKEKDEFGDETSELEDDAEDVDFDTFDDVDEL